MNLEILFDSASQYNKDTLERENPDILKFSKQTVYIPKTILHVNYLPLFGHNFKLFCESCYNNEDVYCIDDDDDMSLNNSDNDNESNDSDFEYDIEDEEEVNTHYDMYYVRRGKYDIY
jgi:hypothetical protein